MTQTISIRKKKIVRNLGTLHPQHEQTAEKTNTFTNPQDKTKNKKVFFKKDISLFTLFFSSEYIKPHEESILKTIIPILQDFSDIRIVYYSATHKNGSFKKSNQLQFIENTQEGLSVSDSVFLFPSQTMQVPYIQECLTTKTVPISFKTITTRKILNSFDPIQEKGNCFLYEKENIWSMFEAIIKAKENYRFSYDWETLIRNCS